MSANVVVPRGQQRITIQCTDADAPGIAAHASVADRDWVVNECSEHPHGPVGALDVVLVTGTQEWAWCPQSNNHAGGLFVPLDIESHPVASYYWKNGYIDGGVSLYRRHHVLYRWTSLWIAGGVDEPGDMYSADGNWNDRELAVDTIKGDRSRPLETRPPRDQLPAPKRQ